jgi:hypothetical protein
VHTTIQELGYTFVEMKTIEDIRKLQEINEHIKKEQNSLKFPYEEFVNMNKTDSDEPFKVKKGVKSGVVYDPGLQRVEKRLAEKISEINLPFE